MSEITDEEATRIIEETMKDVIERLSSTPPSNNAEVIAKTWCDSRNVEYVSHHVDEEGMLHITCRSGEPLHYITLEGTINV